MAPFVCSCLSAFIRVHPRLLLLVCLGSGGRKEKKWDMNWNFVGVDFGQARDYTAIAVLERAENCPMQDEHETGVDSNAA